MRVILLLGFAKIFKFYWGLLRLKQRLLKLECFFQLIWVFRTLSWKETLNLVQALHDDSPAPASVTNLIYEVQVMSYEFRRVRFSRVCRKGNVPTHLLAKHVINIDDFSVWIEESPCFLKQTLLHDVSDTIIS